ncbi:ribokinase, Carbohydrate kinase PfkB, Ribokinase-like protein [Artemisia annua]|uniref:Ribokinase, Carbohydrate kinase PfkB, Ribokinase-like protein n=1 Tax=Artemisia annua TaxID=35608 RepID=A0A2U1Q4V8_ARTAN|nr:ribokinase, Carbohydrate kinase PfkB, Ribokinase-like protein [Artemisia annua]
MYPETVHITTDYMVEDTTGAGDAFIGAILYAICTNLPPEQMLPFAAQVATISCRDLGARTGLPHISDPRLAPFLGILINKYCFDIQVMNRVYNLPMNDETQLAMVHNQMLQNNLLVADALHNLEQQWEQVHHFSQFRTTTADAIVIKKVMETDEIMVLLQHM